MARTSRLEFPGLTTSLISSRRLPKICWCWTSRQTLKAPAGAWSYGPMFHFDGYNLAVTKARGGNWSIAVNLNVPICFSVENSNT
jgi:hypothetical protein